MKNKRQTMENEKGDATGIKRQTDWRKGRTKDGKQEKNKRLTARKRERQRKKKREKDKGKNSEGRKRDKTEKLKT